jgi:hypothetical protein
MPSHFAVPGFDLVQLTRLIWLARFTEPESDFRMLTRSKSYLLRHGQRDPVAHDFDAQIENVVLSETSRRARESPASPLARVQLILDEQLRIFGKTDCQFDGRSASIINPCNSC